MKCPFCFAKGNVVDSRPSSRRGRDYIRRRYHCTSEPASHRWSSVEIAVAEDGRQFDSLFDALARSLPREH